MAQNFISRFHPHQTDPALLEALFVKRSLLAENWLEKLRDSILTDSKHHLLAVGAQGYGKSHLVALILARLRQDPQVAKRVRIAWLSDVETTPSFWKFLLRILRALTAAYPAEFPNPPREGLATASDEQRAELLTHHLLTHLAGKPLLLVVENLDDVLRGLKDEGQKRWRAFLQEHRVVATLATAEQLTEDLSGRERPFFNFFQIEHLKPLTTDEALSLLETIAQQTGNTDLVPFLQSPAGRARIGAIRHLAGGRPRVWITLSRFATREKLDQLVPVVEELLDELTPHYQERLRGLPDQQREIVEFLCRQAHTVQVKEIARELFLSEQTAAAQLKALKDKEYVTSATRGRESCYELAEPLMRLCIEGRSPQQETIRPLVEFLRDWYEPPLAQIQPLRSSLEIPADLLGRPEKALMALSQAIKRAPKKSSGWKQRGQALLHLGRFDEAVSDLRRANQLGAEDRSAFDSLAAAHILGGHWDLAEIALKARFQLSRGDTSLRFIGNLPDVLMALLLATSDRRIRTRRIDQLVNIAAKAGQWSLVAQALVHSLTRIDYENLSLETLEAWQETWQKIAQAHTEFALAARLFYVGVRYIQFKDERILLDLLQEERTILVDLFCLNSNTVQA
jgi:tetratricopeptide (TPR) repeat protein